MKSYWEGEGKHEALVKLLDSMIPPMGKSNPRVGLGDALEVYRVAVNCYYDFYNNGLCNRAAEFRKVFGFGGKFRGKKSDDMLQRAKLEEAMDKIIVAAAIEQGLENPPVKKLVSWSVDHKGGSWAHIDAPDHHCLAQVVYRMKDGKELPELEQNVRVIVNAPDAINALVEMVIAADADFDGGDRPEVTAAKAVLAKVFPC